VPLRARTMVEPAPAPHRPAPPPAGLREIASDSQPRMGRNECNHGIEE
jgi:hypothetical protein